MYCTKCSGTVFIEPKLIRGASNVAHIEDIVVDPNFRGKKIAHSILSTLKLFAIKNSCYKVILDCDSKLQEFYEKNDFEVKQIQMGKYFWIRIFISDHINLIILNYIIWLSSEL